MKDADACFEEGMKHIGLSWHADYPRVDASSRSRQSKDPGRRRSRRVLDGAAAITV